MTTRQLFVGIELRRGCGSRHGYRYSPVFDREREERCARAAEPLPGIAGVSVVRQVGKTGRLWYAPAEMEHALDLCIVGPGRLGTALATQLQRVYDCVDTIVARHSSIAKAIALAEKVHPVANELDARDF